MDLLLSYKQFRSNLLNTYIALPHDEICLKSLISPDFFLNTDSILFYYQVKAICIQIFWLQSIVSLWLRIESVHTLLSDFPYIIDFGLRIKQKLLMIIKLMTFTVATVRICNFVSVIKLFSYILQICNNDFRHVFR